MPGPLQLARIAYVKGPKGDKGDPGTGGTGGGVPTTRLINTTAPLAGGGDLSADRTLTVATFVGSGAGHAVGVVPDAGAVAGTTKFLREDATWVVPPAAAAADLDRVLTANSDLAANKTRCIAGPYRVPDTMTLTVRDTAVLGVY